MKRAVICAVLAALLSLFLAGPALAGAPDVQGQKPPSGVGGLPPQAPPEGWTEYPPAPAKGGTVHTEPITWPPPDPFDWLNRIVNPGKWLVDGLTGALTGLIHALHGVVAQVTFWFFGADTPNPYGGDIPVPFDVVTYTRLELTINSPIVYDMRSAFTSVAACFLGFIISMTALRELLSRMFGREGRSLGEIFRRLVTALALSLWGWVIAWGMILLNNLLIGILTPWRAAGDALSAVMYSEVAGRLYATGLVFETALALLVFTVCLFILAVIMISRIVLLDILIILSPLAGMAYAMEETEFLWNRWINALISATFYQFVSMLFLTLGLHWMQSAWNLTGSNPILCAALGIVAVVMSISGPPILAFAVSRAAAAAAQRTTVQVIAAVGR